MFTFSNAFAAGEVNNVLYTGQNLFGIEKSDKAQIKELLNNLNKYSNEHNIAALKEFYAKDYISYDGFNHSAFFAAIEETFKLYPDISYKSKIKSVNIFGDWAAAELIDTTISKKQTIAHYVSPCGIRDLMLLHLYLLVN